MNFIKNIYPANINSSEFLRSVGASRGCITILQSRKLGGSLAFMNEYGLSEEFTSQLTRFKWILTNIYAPCKSERKPQFIEWLQNMNMPEEWD